MGSAMGGARPVAGGVRSFTWGFSKSSNESGH
jgi:hypothetical protein